MPDSHKAMPSTAFTIHFNGISSVLKSEVTVSQAFDPSEQSEESFSHTSYTAIWDTGATNSVISEKVVQECALEPIGISRNHTANGIRNCNVYLINVVLPNKVRVVFVRVTEAPLFNFDVLIGMDIIGAGDFAVSNKDGKTAFTFRVPSLKKIDFVEEINEARKKGKSGKYRKKKHPYAM